MVWKCPSCGTEGNADGEKCFTCPYSLVPSSITLETDDGRKLSFHIGCRFNRTWARSVFGEDGQYWDSDRQMTLERRADGWYVVPNASARNETLVNELSITAPVPLVAGSVVAVGRQGKVVKTRLKVSL